MGTTARTVAPATVRTAILVGLLCASTTEPARAQPNCQPLDGDGQPFAACFDPGNRLAIQGTTSGVGALLDLRHSYPTDDPDVVWRIEHGSAATLQPDGAFAGTLYSGRFLRHSRDGHVVLPLGPPRKLFVPFDIGAEAEFGSLTSRAGEPTAELGVFRGAALLELSRASHFRRRIAIGVVGRWDMQLDRDTHELSAPSVVPFSMGMLDLYAESDTGLTLAQLRVEAGANWSTAHQWRNELTANLRVERVLVAVNNLPVALYASAHYRSADEELTGQIGVRFAFITPTVK